MKIQFLRTSVIALFAAVLLTGCFSSSGGSNATEQLILESGKKFDLGDDIILFMSDVSPAEEGEHELEASIFIEESGSEWMEVLKDGEQFEITEQLQYSVSKLTTDPETATLTKQ